MTTKTDKERTAEMLHTLCRLAVESADLGMRMCPHVPLAETEQQLLAMLTEAQHLHHYGDDNRCQQCGLTVQTLSNQTKQEEA